VVRIVRSEGSIVRDSRTFSGVGDGVLVSVAEEKAGSVATQGLITATGKAVVYDSQVK
jgi:predicted Rossmann fold nucleotide-binding protein DprA/Smf involved in DNA uptake